MSTILMLGQPRMSFNENLKSLRFVIGIFFEIARHLRSYLVMILKRKENQKAVLIVGCFFSPGKENGNHYNYNKDTILYHTSAAFLN